MDLFLHTPLKASRPGIRRGESLEAIGIGYLRRHQSPTHHRQFSLASLAIGSDHRLESRWRDVVVRRQFEARLEFAHLKGFGNALFVRSAIVTGRTWIIRCSQSYLGMSHQGLLQLNRTVAHGNTIPTRHQFPCYATSAIGRLHRLRQRAQHCQWFLLIQLEYLDE